MTQEELDAEIAKVDKDYLRGVLISMGLSELHNPPLSSDTPKIEINVGGVVYNAEVVKKDVYVREGVIDEEDILIRTTKLEIVKMKYNKDYIKTSFMDGKSSIELIAGNFELFSKGYLDLYKRFK